jgi:voltage-gated potassium channel
MFSTLRSLARDPEGKVLLGSAITTVAVGTVVYMFLEGWDWIDALYFSVVTLATVGFGDLHPTTDEAKLFTIVYIIFGVGILAGFVSEVARRRTGLDRATPVIDGIQRASGHVRRRSEETEERAAAAGASATAEAAGEDETDAISPPRSVL